MKQALISIAIACFFSSGCIDLDWESSPMMGQEEAPIQTETFNVNDPTKFQDPAPQEIDFYGWDEEPWTDNKISFRCWSNPSAVHDKRNCTNAPSFFTKKDGRWIKITNQK